MCEMCKQGMEKTASWADVAAKGRAIFESGGVEIIKENAYEIEAYVMSIQVADRFPVTEGGIYNVVLAKKTWENRSNVGGWIQGWLCDCIWGSYNSGQPGSRWLGRFCSHAYSVMLAANSRARKDFMRDHKNASTDNDFWYRDVFCQIDKVGSLYSVRIEGAEGFGIEEPEDSEDLNELKEAIRRNVDAAFRSDKYAKENNMVKFVKRSQVYSWDDEEYNDLERERYELERPRTFDELSQKAQEDAIRWWHENVGGYIANIGLEEDYSSFERFLDSVNCKAKQHDHYSWFYVTVSLDDEGWEDINRIPEGESDGLWLAEGMLEQWQEKRQGLIKLLEVKDAIGQEYEDAYNELDMENFNYDDWDERYYDALADLRSAYEEAVQEIADSAVGDMKAEWDAIAWEDDDVAREYLSDGSYEFYLDEDGNLDYVG